MKHDPTLHELLLVNARDGGRELEIANYKPALVLEQQVCLIEEGLAGGAVIKDGLEVRWVKNFHITAAGHKWLERIDANNDAALMHAAPEKSKIRIFISHGSADVDLAEALIDLVEKALRIAPHEIRCTSVTGYSLNTGARIEDQLRTEIEQSEVLIALITEAALSSTYVLFELGARWGLRRPLFLVLGKGLKGGALEEPLKALAAASCDKRGEIFTLIETLAGALSIVAARPSTYDKAVIRLLAASKTRTTTPPKTETHPTEPLSLSPYEIFALQTIAGGGYAPMVEDIIGQHFDITTARARQTLESIRRKGLAVCRVRSDGGDIEYSLTEMGIAWFNSNTLKIDPD